MKKIFLYLIVFTLAIFNFNSLSFAQDKITILISGQSHASLYPCHCPSAPVGGVARRATLIKNIRNEEKNVLVLEAGGSFAGGSYDTSSQTTELDKDRTKFYMQSLVKMGYDAFLISSKEFNFGDDFLSEAMSEYKLNYLSANLEGDFTPYLIKEVGSVKVAIIGITDAEVKTKTQTPYITPEKTLSNVIKEIKDDKKANLVIVLSYLGEKKSRELINKIEGVDIWVGSNNPFMSASNQNINGTLLIMPAWQVRELTKINLDISTLAVEKVEHVDLDEELKDDIEVSSIIPSCFTDKDCHKPGFIAKCQNAGTKKSKCDYSKIKPVKLTVIKPKLCRTCNIDEVIERIKKILPNLKVKYLDEKSKPSQNLIKKLNIKMLPAYLIEQPIEREEVVSKINQIAQKIDNYYVLEPGFTGVSYFTGRKKIPNRLDLFFDIGTKDIVKILDVLQMFKSKKKDIDIHLNFLAVEDSELGFIAKGERYEIEEFLRSVCINKYYPDKLWYYLSCRLSDIGSSWWDDCVVKFDMDPERIKGCARTQEGKMLLREFIKLTQELEVVFGPTFLINNQEIFSSEGVPSVEELEELFK
ncbi:MAG: bifunctional metallophosphatase/5'-nucleotidase [Candidatus Omnitrophica bacterium]|nr:bifunctional metallophosphatase/5'-nucleotidase [Candidatus Omnitrophota bacterium]